MAGAFLPHAAGICRCGGPAALRKLVTGIHEVSVVDLPDDGVARRAAGEFTKLCVTSLTEEMALRTLRSNDSVSYDPSPMIDERYVSLSYKLRQRKKARSDMRETSTGGIT